MCFSPFLCFFLECSIRPRPRNPTTQPLSHLRRYISPTLVEEVRDVPEAEVDLRPNEPIYLVLESPSLKLVLKLELELVLKLELKRLTTSLLAFLVLRPITLHTDIYKISSIFFFKYFNTCLK